MGDILVSMKQPVGVILSTLLGLLLLTVVAGMVYLVIVLWRDNNRYPRPTGDSKALERAIRESVARQPDSRGRPEEGCHGRR